MRGLTSAHLRALADLVGRLADGGVLTGVYPRDLLAAVTIVDADLVAATKTDAHWFAEVTYADDGTTLLALTGDAWTEV